MMSSAFLLLSLLGICLATPYKMETELEPMSDEEIFFINSVQSSWKAGRNFKQEDYEKVITRLGVDTEANKLYNKLHPIPVSDVEIRDDLPEQFDARQKWPNCTRIGEIDDQSACGSGWALASTEVMTDRICIHTKTLVQLSAEDIVACCERCGTGCGKGHPYAAWSYYEEEGVVTGGSYNSNEGCMPYSLPQCDHFVSGKYKPCPKRHYPTPRCTKMCREGYGKTYEQDKYYGQRVKYFQSEEQIMQELVDNGPISTVIIVYSDFLSYKSGVYYRTSDRYSGAQALKIIGYGKENGQKYWLATNSWNEDWGDKGFVKILRGVNECQIERQALAGLPEQSFSNF